MYISSRYIQIYIYIFIFVYIQNQIHLWIFVVDISWESRVCYPFIDLHRWAIEHLSHFMVFFRLSQYSKSKVPYGSFNFPYFSNSSNSSSFRSNQQPATNNQQFELWAVLVSFGTEAIESQGTPATTFREAPPFHVQRTTQWSLEKMTWPICWTLKSRFVSIFRRIAVVSLFFGLGWNRDLRSYCQKPQEGAYCY